MKKKKVLVIFIIIILLLISIFLINTTRKYVIITKLQQNLSNYSESANNYYMKTIILDNEKKSTIMEYYKKDNKQMVKIQKTENNKLKTTSMYDDGNTVNLYVDSEDSKIANLDSGMSMDVSLVNFLESYSKWSTFLNCIPASVKSVDYNGKNCYLVSNFMSPTSLNEKSDVYIEKDTGLLVKVVSENLEFERAYAFGDVEDNAFTEPDKSQYNIQ